MRFRGWQKVFKFTFVQNIKNKSFIVSTILMNTLIILMVLGINFIPPLLLGDDLGASDSDITGEEELFKGITDIYIINESRITSLDLTVFESEGIAITEVAISELDSITEKIYDSQNAEILIHIMDMEERYDILVSRPLSEEVIDKSSCDMVASVFSDVFKTAKLKSLGIGDEEIIEVNKSIYSVSTIAGEAPKSEIAYVINSVVPMLSSLILFVFILAYGQIIAQAIATEKTSRVMELLLTSVRPLAVIVGKIFAIGLVSISQLTFMGLITTGAFIISAPFGLLGQITGSVEATNMEMSMVADEVKMAFGSFSPMVIVWIVVLFVLGFVFFSLIAGLIGASISRLEDLNIAMQPLALISVLGFYLSYMPSALNFGGGTNTLMIVARYLPISSPFSLPSALILGEISNTEIILPVLILALCDILMFLIVAKVYESIVLHTGDRIKLKDIAKLVRGK